jgi:hypothetical protein
VPFAATPPAPPSRASLARAGLRNLLARVLADATEELWTIGVLDVPVAELVGGGFDPRRIRWLEPPEGGLLADPAAWPLEDGTTVVLAEGLAFEEDVGRIVALGLAPDGSAASPCRTVLRRPCHLSYPQLVDGGNGTVYCLPEMWQAGRVQLFRADPFPNRWVEDRVLLDGVGGVDPTLFHDGERYWLFLADQDDEPDGRLFLHHSPSLAGPWQAHPRNPVKTDLRSSRPAGPLFAHDGALFRPAQDCTETYGGAVVINRVLTLTPEDFAETPVARLAPDPSGPFPHGLHTLAPAGRLTLVDGKRHVLSWRRAARSLVAAARKRLRRPRQRRQVTPA